MILRPSCLPAVRHASRAARRAFTLMEVLVVVAIIFILASVSTIVVFRYLDESKEKLARAGVKTLETAVKAHKVSHQDFPQSLEELTMPVEGKAAALEDSALIDPWGRPYVYDVSQRNPKTGVPLIYSAGPEPGNAAGFIRNW
jgi:general secretion pathway protein G